MYVDSEAPKYLREDLTGLQVVYSIELHIQINQHLGQLLVDKNIDWTVHFNPKKARNCAYFHP